MNEQTNTTIPPGEIPDTTMSIDLQKIPPGERDIKTAKKLLKMLPNVGFQGMLGSHLVYWHEDTESGTLRTYPVPLSDLRNFNRQAADSARALGICHCGTCFGDICNEHGPMPI